MNDRVPAGEAPPAPEPAPELAGDAQANTPSSRRALSLSLRTTFAAQLLMAISGVMLARVLGTDDRGAIAAAMIWPTVIAGLGTLGLNESLTYHVAKEPENAGRLLGSGLALAAIQSLVATALSMAVVPLALSGHGSDTIEAGLVYSLFVPLIIFGVAFLGTLNGLHRYGSFSLTRISLFALMVFGQLALLLFDASSVMSLVTAFVGAQAGMAILGGLCVRRAHPGRLQVERAEMQRLFSYGWRSNTGSSSSFLNQRLDQLVISAFMSAGQLGLYVVAVNLTQIAGLVGNAVAYAALPNISALEPGKERTQLARKLIGFTMLLSTALALPVILFSPLLIEILFGSDFEGASDVARVLAAGAIVFSTARAVEAVLRAVGRPLAAGLGEVIALVATFAGLAVLLPLIGIIGAAITSLVARAVSCTWMATRLAEPLGTKPWIVLMPEREVFSDGWRMLTSRLRGRKATGDGGGAAL